jgi:hypothetical protein
MNATDRCRHQGCRCDGTPNFNGYCSQACAAADQGSRGGACPCGHGPCRKPEQAEAH